MDNQQGNVLDRIGYSIGYLLGDGNLYADPYKGDYRVSFASGDLDCLQRVEAEVGTGGKFVVLDRARCCTLTYYSKALWQAMVDLTAFKKEVPLYYLQDAEKVVMLDVLAGLIDSDGSMRKRKPKGRNTLQFQLNFYNNELGIIEGFRRLCKNLGIRTNPLRNYISQSGRVSYDLGVVLKDFAQVGRLHCKRKQQVLDEYKREVKGRWAPEHHYHERPSETKPAAPCEGDDIVHTGIERP